MWMGRISIFPIVVIFEVVDPQVGGQRLSTREFPFQSMVGLCARNQSVPRMMSLFPVLVIDNSVVSQCLSVISMWSIAVCQIAPFLLMVPSTFRGNIGCVRLVTGIWCFLIKWTWAYFPSAPLSRSAWASIFDPLCTIRTLRRIEGVLKFRNVFTGTLWAFRVFPIALVVQRGIETTLADDAAGE